MAIVMVMQRPSLGLLRRNLSVFEDIHGDDSIDMSLILSLACQQQRSALFMHACWPML